MGRESKSFSRTKVNLLVDIAIFVGFLVATAPRFSGLAIHEWLGLAFAVGIMAHLLLHWHWLVAVSQRIFAKLPRQQRLNYLLNILLFIDITIVSFTGVMISEAALPLLGIRFQPNFFYRSLHSLSSDAAIGLLGLHVALHWSWIVNASKRYLGQPFAKRQPGFALVLPTGQKELAE